VQYWPPSLGGEPGPVLIVDELELELELELDGTMKDLF
jgi:hypothetical protein